MKEVDDRVSSEQEREEVFSGECDTAVPDDFAEEGSPESSLTVEELVAALESAEGKISELTDSLARARADFFNYRKRVERDRQKERAMIAEEKALEFLPVLDNLDRALSVPPDADGKSLLQGVTMVRRQFLSVLEAMGVEPVPGKGAAFSPEFHEAVAAVPTDDPEQDGIVVEEIQPGYRTKERVLRPAKVKVGAASEI